MKMLIKLNDEQIMEDGKSLEEVWSVIDSVFDEYECEKIVENDGSVIYQGNAEKECGFSDIEMIYVSLKDNEVIKTYALKWWLLGDEETLDGEYYCYEDCLQISNN